MAHWLGPLVGGILIGLAATVLLWLNGRVAGISGIVNGLVRRAPPGDWAWRAAFVLWLMGAGGLAMRMLDQATPSPAPLPQLLVAGLLVGYGTSLGGGCTSGHGVCGLARLSKRSLVATATFIAVAVATVFLVRHVFGGAA
jgi:uncharacterized membrane protein YedE/YeeE